MMGALVGSGVPPWFMVAYSSGERFPGLADVDQSEVNADRNGGAVFRWHRSLPRLALGSPRLALRAVRNPIGRPPAALFAGFLPRGFISTEPLKNTVRRAVPSGWSPHPNLWIVATDYESGERVVFGRDGAPACDLADAVAASCAIPGFYHPVSIAGHPYMDGGVASTSNLDLLADLGLDLVICLNPMSSLHRTRSLGVAAQPAGPRGTAGARVGHPGCADPARRGRPANHGRELAQRAAPE